MTNASITRDEIADIIRGHVYTETPDPFDVKGIEGAAAAIVALFGQSPRDGGDGWKAGAEAMRAQAVAHLRLVADAMEAGRRGDLGSMFAMQSASDLRRQADRIEASELPSPNAGAPNTQGGGR